VGLDPQSDWQDQLQTSLRRAQDAIQRGVQQQDEMVRTWTASLRSAYPDWGRERWQRQLERKLRKRAEREARIANASLFEGYLWALGAVVLGLAALSSMGALWWLCFPAWWLGTRGARVIARHAAGGKAPEITAPPELLQLPPAVRAQVLASAEARAAEARARRFGSLGPLGTLGDDLRHIGTSLRDLTTPGGAAQGSGGQTRPSPFTSPVAPAYAAPAADPRDVRVDQIAEKILAELKSSPQVVRDIFRKPEETVRALRDTCRDLTRRERDVRRFLSPDEDARLATEREALHKRVEAETDEVTHGRLASALAALDQQRMQRQELARSASRFEAEHTRITYTLESLFTQVVRMRSADAGSVDVAGAGLRRSLDNLSQEVDELADALERVNTEHQGTTSAAGITAPAAGAGKRVPLEPPSQSDPDGDGSGRSPNPREKA
jgi:uncharacterized protein YukE